MTTVLAIGDRVDTTFLLEVHDIFDSLLLDRYELLWLCGAISNSISFLDKLIRPEQRSNVLCSERRVPWRGGHYF